MTASPPWSRTFQGVGSETLFTAGLLAVPRQLDILRESQTLGSEREAMDVARELDSRDVPAAVGFAAIIGLGKAAFEVIFGVIGILAAKTMDDSFGGGMLAFGIVFAIASLMLLRGSRVGYYVTVVLSALGLVVAVVYLFRAESGVFGGTLVVAFFNAVVLYLLLGRTSARAYFGLSPRQDEPA
jgi:hypothetical protein